MFPVLLLVAGLGVVLLCVRWRPRRAVHWWALLAAGVTLILAGAAAWYITASGFDSALSQRWGGRALLAFSIGYAFWLLICAVRSKGAGELRWSRKRRFAAALALVALLAGAWIVPKLSFIRQDGPWAAAPTTLLIAGLGVLPESAERELLSRPWRQPFVQWSDGRDLMWDWQLQWAKARVRDQARGDPSPDKLRAAVRAMNAFEDSAAAARACELSFHGLISADAEFQRLAMKTLPSFIGFKITWGGIGSEFLDRRGAEFLPHLIRLLDSDDAAKRSSAMRVISHMGTAAIDAAPKLTQMLRACAGDQDEYWVWGTLKDIGVDMTTFRQQLVDEIRAADLTVRLEALQRVAWFHEWDEDGSVLLEAVLDRMRDGDVTESLLAAEKAVALSSRNAIRDERILKGLLEEGDRRANPDAHLSMITDHFLSALPLESVRPLLSHRSASVRMAAVHAARRYLSPHNEQRAYAAAWLSVVAKMDDEPAIRAAAAEPPPFDGLASFTVETR